MFQGFQHGLDDLRFIFNLNLRMHQQAEARKALLILFFQQLIIQGAAAKLGWQNLLQNVQHVPTDKGNPFASELAKAVYVAYVLGIAVSLKRTSTGARFNYAVVIAFHIQ